MSTAAKEASQVRTPRTARARSGARRGSPEAARSTHAQARARPRHACRTAIVWGAVAAALMTPSVALAGDEDVVGGFQLPPVPADRDPALVFGVRTGFVFPVSRGQVCPPVAACVLGGGGTMGIWVDRRWPSGVSVGLGYDASFLDSSGVFELGVLQALEARVRWLFLTDRAIHPFASIGAGAVAFGESLSVATAGGVATLAAGAEVELTERLALDLLLPVRVFATAPFTTKTDRTSRAGELGLNVLVTIEVGLVVVDG